MTANVRVVTSTRPDVLRVSPTRRCAIRPPGEEPPADRRRPAPTGPGGTPFQRPAPALASRRSRRASTKELKLTDEQQKKLEPILEESRSQFTGAQPRPPGAAAHRRAAHPGGVARRRSARSSRPSSRRSSTRCPRGSPARGGAAARPGGSGCSGPDGKPRAVAIRLGISDGTATEVARRRAQGGRRRCWWAPSPPGSAARARPASPPPQQQTGPRMRL